MRRFILSFAMIAAGTIVAAQSCPVVTTRNNGNNSNCWLDQSLEYGTKQGNLIINFTSPFPSFQAPNVSVVWLNQNPIPCYVGAPSPPTTTGPVGGVYTHQVNYCFYNVNLMPVGSDIYTLKFTNLDGSNYSLCSFTKSNDNTTTQTNLVTPNVTILTNPASLSICQQETAVFSVTASTLSGTNTYIWQISTNGGVNYSNVSNGVSSGYLYSGATTSSLSVATSLATGTGLSRPPIYRLKITNSGFDYYSGSAELRVNALSFSSSSMTIFKSQTPYVWNGNSYYLSGAYTDTLINTSGCDSVATLNLTVRDLMDSCNVGTLASLASDSWNGAWVDYDNDGWEDLFVADKDADRPNQLFRNNGNGGFTRIVSGPLVNEKANTTASSWADINNDGNLDVFIVNSVGAGSSLYLNNGGGSFSLLTNTGIDPDPQYFHGASWADFDNDGFVDLIITSFFPTRFHHLYRNNGDNTFTIMPNTPITMVSERAMAPILADYDNDGLVDVFIPNGDNRPNSLFRNTGNFNFIPVTTGDIATDANNSVGASWGDYDNDGFLDLFVSNASGQNNVLYRNNGDGTFVKVSTSAISQDGGHSHGSTWADIDNDADLDLFVCNDNGPGFLYLNDGAGNFTRNTEERITANLGNTFGQAWADYNRDGFLDVALFTHSGQTNKFFCNQGASGNWISIKLVGTVSNKSAIGAKVRVKSGGKWQKREIQTNTGLGSQNSLHLHFGLGAATSVDSILISWPSGFRQVITSGVSVNTFLTINEQASKRVHGITFHDMNGNGTREQSEPLVGSVRLKAMPAGISTASNDDGFFELYLSNGIYTIEPVALSYWSHSGVHTFTIDATNDSAYVQIPLTASVNGYDLSIDFSNSAWRRGFTNITQIHIKNHGNSDAADIVVNMNYPQEGYVISSGSPYSQTQPGQYSWMLSILRAGESVCIQVSDSIGLTAYTGQMLTLGGDVRAAGQDLNLSNNSKSMDIEVVGAIDPNDILVSPRGEGKQGYVSKNQILTYTIRFQNVGTYKAHFVRIENAIPSHLDPETFEILHASHDYTYWIDGKGVLRVLFDNINLPDSSSDEPGSHGHISYQIRPRTGLTGGERVLNSAAISFDYEAPITTNTVLNTIKTAGSPEAYTLLVYPNPTQGILNVSIDPRYFMYEEVPSLVNYVIMESKGQIVHSGDASGRTLIELDLGRLQKGLYLIKAIDSNNQIHTGRFIFQ